MKSILECSKRTITKIALRMKLACFECGWDDCICDVHHILETSKGGSDSAANLTYLCPNCHRKAHKGLLRKMRTFEEVIGESWKDYYNVTPRTGKKRPFTGKVEITEKMQLALEKGRRTRSAKAAQRATEAIQRFKAAQINVTERGWMSKASKELDIAPQRVVWYLRKHLPSVLEGVRLRSK